MIFDLVRDFADILEAMPAEHPRHRILKLLDEAIRRDVHFIDRHPTTLFQCLWNTCWWYDCPAAAHHYDPPSNGWPPHGAPWQSALPKLYIEAQRWERHKDMMTPGFLWFRARRAPSVPLNQALHSVRQIAPPPHALGVSHDGRRVAIVSQKHLETFDPLSREVELEFEISLRAPGPDFAQPSVRPPECVWFDDHKMAISDGVSSEIQIWDLQSHSVAATLSLDGNTNLPDPLPWSDLCFLRAKRFLTASRVTPLQFIWNSSRTQAIPARLEGSSAPPSLTCVWSSETGQPIALVRPGRACSAVSLTRDGELFAIAWDRTIVVYYIGEQLRDAFRFYKSRSPAPAVPFNIELLHATHLFRCDLHRAEVTRVRFLNDCRRLAVVEPYGRVELYDVLSGERCWVSSTESMYSMSNAVGLAPAEDDSFLVSLWRKRVYVLNVSDGAVGSTLSGARSDVESAAVIGGSKFVVALTQGELCVWDAERHDDAYFLKGTGDPGFAVFNPESRQLVSECPASIIWWDVKTGRILREQPRDASLWVQEIIGLYRGRTAIINTSEKPPLIFDGVQLIEGRFEQVDEAVSIRDGARHIGWLPRIRFFTSHPEGDLVAGSIGNDVCLYEFVGEPRAAGSLVEQETLT